MKPYLSIYSAEKRAANKSLLHDIELYRVEQLANNAAQYYQLDRITHLRKIGLTYALAAQVFPVTIHEKNLTFNQNYEKLWRQFSQNTTVSNARKIIDHVINSAENTKMLKIDYFTGLDEESYAVFWYTHLLWKEDFDKSINLYDFWDNILDGDGLSNVYEHRQMIYEWSIIDVIPAALKGEWPQYFFFLGEFIPREEFFDYPKM